MGDKDKGVDRMVFELDCNLYIPVEDPDAVLKAAVESGWWSGHAALDPKMHVPPSDDPRDVGSALVWLINDRALGIPGSGAVETSYQYGRIPPERPSAARTGLARPVAPNVALRAVIAAVLAEEYSPRELTPDGLLGVIADMYMTVGASTPGGTAQGTGLITVGVLMHWLVAARESLDVPPGPAAVSWIDSHLGPEQAGQALILAGLLGHVGTAKVTVSQALEQLGEGLVPALLWLVAALTATAGGGNVEWLVQFDQDPATT